MITTEPPARTSMNGKPVISIPAKSVINLESAFSHKLLCDGPTFSTGSACAYSCAFCYVPDLMRKNPHMSGIDAPHESVVVRRLNPLEIIRSQLTRANGEPKFPDPSDRRVIFSSPLVDIAANMELVRETIEACRLILTLTHWQIRLLSKSNLLPKIAEALPEYNDRIIYGVSSGTFDDGLAHAFEAGTPLVSKRIASLHRLQDMGCRTYGMICPSLPLETERDYTEFAHRGAELLRADKLEHVWGEVINVRGDSMTRTVRALRDGGFSAQANRLLHVSTDKSAWEEYARSTFSALAKTYTGTGKLRFLQYITAASGPWWKSRIGEGAVIL